MGLLKSLFQAFRSDSLAFQKAVNIHQDIQRILGDKITVSPIELDNAVQMITGDKIMSQRVLDAAGFTVVYDLPKVIDYNKIFDAILHELNKRL